MKRKIKISGLIILCIALMGTMLFFGVNSIKAEATEREITASGTYGDVSWTLYDDGELLLCGDSSISNIGISSIPWSDFVSSITKITIGKDILSVEKDAFSDLGDYSSLEVFDVEEGNTNFSVDENGALFNYDKTTLIRYPIAGSFNEYHIPNGVLTVHNYAFEACNIRKITMSSTITEIGYSCFGDCTFLESVEMGENVQKIGIQAFSSCKSLISIRIPSKVKKLPLSIFKFCEKLESVELSNEVTSIEGLAFENCRSLKNIFITEKVASIGNTTFSGCTALDSISVSPQNQYFSSDSSGVLFNKYKTELIKYPAGKTNSSYVVPDTVKNIHILAFASASSLTSISIPDNIEFIGQNAFINTGFYNNKANWDNGFLYVGTCLVNVDKKAAKSNCKVFSKTTLIAEGAFAECKITDVTMPDNVKYVNRYAFKNCSNLENVHFSKNQKILSEGTFFGCVSLKTIEIPSTISVIESYAFENCKKLNNVVLTEGLTQIGVCVFRHCSKLNQIYIPKTMTTLKLSTFNSSEVTDIYYDDSKAEWKRLVNGSTFNNLTIHYTLRSDDESVIINHTDDNFDYEAGNVHLVVTELDKVTSKFDQNGFYNRLMADPIQVLDIKLVDGDGNDIQPLSDETITVKIKASEEFINLMKSGLSAVSEYDIAAESIDFSNDCFVFENNGETVSVPASEAFLKKFKVIHWFSDAVEPTDHESFTHDEISVKNGYIVLETNHFSEYAVCTELVEFELGEIELANGESTSVSVNVNNGTEVTYTSSDESVVTVDENGVITAVGPGTATITVTINGTNISDTCEVTVPARDFTIKWIVDGVETEQTVSEQAVIIRPENPEKEGYTFVGWTPEVPDTMPAQNLEFNAEWQVNQYTITFDTAGGSAVAPITLAYGSEISAPQNPVLDGYVFKGWIPAIPETMPAYDMTLTAVYEKVFVSEINIISLPNKTQYTYRIDSLDLSGIAIQVVYSDGSKEVITDTNAIKAYGFSADSTGTKTVTVEYGGCTATFGVTVSYAWWQWIIRILLLGFLWY